MDLKGKIQPLGYSKDGKFVRFNVLLQKSKPLCIAYGFYNFDLGVTYIRATMRAGKKFRGKYVEMTKQLLKSNDWDSVVHTYGERRISKEAFNRIWNICIF